MAKNMTDTSYRKLDVEGLAENAFHEDQEPGTPAAGPDERAAMQMVQNGKYLEALKELVNSAPLKTGSQIVKDQACQTAANVLAKFKLSDIESAVAQLSRDEADVLLHYVFRAFELVDDQQACTAFLAFHNEIFKKCGHGGILRVLCASHRLHPVEST